MSFATSSTKNRIRIAGSATTWSKLLGITIFMALLVRLLIHAPELEVRLIDSWDPFWLNAYAAATLAMGALLWWRKGRLLFLVAVAIGTTILLLPMLSGATGWALPKLVLVSAVAVGIGHRILRMVTPGAECGTLDGLLLSTVLGYGVLSLLMFLLGVLHCWSPAFVVSALLVIGIWVRRDLYVACRTIVSDGIRPFLSTWRGDDMRLPALVLSSFCICGFGCYIYSIAPNTHGDVMHYHLGVTAIYVLRGGFVELDHTFAVHLVRNPDMLYGLGLLIEGQPLPTLINFLFGMLAVGFVASLGTLLVDRRVGMLAACIFFAIPLVTYVIAEGLVDLFLTAYVLAATYAGFRWQRERNRHWIVLFSLLAGFAAGTKLNAFIFLAPLATILVMDKLFRGGGWLGWKRDAAALFLPGTVVFGPWVVFTWIRTGSPLFPFLNNVFHSPHWFQNSFTPGGDWAGMGLGTKWIYALRLPWDLTFHGERFGELAWFATAGVVLLGLPFCYTVVPAGQRRPMLLLTLLTAISLAVFFKLVQYPRYMLPAIALSTIVAAMNCRSVWQFSLRCPRAKFVPIGCCVVLGLSWLVFTRAVHLSELTHWHPERYPWQLALGRQSQAEYLSQVSMREYESLKFINDRVTDKPAVLLSVAVCTGFYSGDAIEYSLHNSVPGKMMVEERLPQRLLTMLEERQVRYLAINHNYCRTTDAGRSLSGTAAVLSKEFLKRHCEPLFSRNEIVIYRLHVGGFHDVALERPSLLANSDMRHDAAGAIENWVSGKVTVLPPSSHSTDPGACVVELTHMDFICQRLPAHPDKLYSLSAEFWSSDANQSCMLQVLCVDALGKQTWNEVFVAPVTAVPERFELACTTVPGTRQVDVYIRAQDGSTVRMAKPRLVERP